MTRQCEIWKKFGNSFRDLPIWVKNAIGSSSSELSIFVLYSKLLSKVSNHMRVIWYDPKKLLIKITKLVVNWWQDDCMDIYSRFDHFCRLYQWTASQHSQFIFEKYKTQKTSCIHWTVMISFQMIKNAVSAHLQWNGTV